jgi:hypothetical protein
MSVYVAQNVFHLSNLTPTDVVAFGDTDGVAETDTQGVSEERQEDDIWR